MEAQTLEDPRTPNGSVSNEKPGYRVAVVGATGAVGTQVLDVLGERNFPVEDLVPFASERSAGTVVAFRDEDLHCRTLEPRLLAGFDVVISSAGGHVSREWAQRFADEGAFVIDKSSALRMDEGVPLVVAGVNNDAITPDTRVIASPNCSTMQMVVALKPIHDVAGLERIVVSTYQSTSGTGNRAVEELMDQSRAMVGGAEPASPEVYPHRIAFNVLPQVETFEDGDDYTTEERKMMAETRKILDEPYLPISATCVRVPVPACHSESINLQTREELSPEDCRELLSATPGVIVRDDPARGVYPLASEAAGRDEVFVGRIRRDPSALRTLNLWVVADNLRKGAATNAVQLAELLVARGLIGAGRRAA